MRQATAERRAREAAAVYAGRQHRHRAINIARTELAAAYNQGAHGAALDAQARGYIGGCVKVWLAADDERVCPECGALDGERAEMGAAFSDGSPLPSAHPSCRCAVAYEEAAAPQAPAPEIPGPPEAVGGRRGRIGGRRIDRSG